MMEDQDRRRRDENGPVRLSQDSGRQVRQAEDEQRGQDGFPQEHPIELDVFDLPQWRYTKRRPNYRLAKSKS
jgi:hypothetical protein